MPSYEVCDTPPDDAAGVVDRGLGDFNAAAAPLHLVEHLAVFAREGGAIIGGLIIGVLNNGMSILGLGIEWQQAVKGLVLLLAVAFDVYNKSQGRRSITGLLMQNFNRRATQDTSETVKQEA